MPFSNTFHTNLAPELITSLLKIMILNVRVFVCVCILRIPIYQLHSDQLWDYIQFLPPLFFNQNFWAHTLTLSIMHWLAWLITLFFHLSDTRSYHLDISLGLWEHYLKLVYNNFFLTSNYKNLVDLILFTVLVVSDVFLIFLSCW